ncbi:tetratricopeptide repeat-containing glycosyltransferase family 2 protein [Sporomusa termitida]|uniref:Peptide S-glycosyltransferase, SunS family n=1 Tax=Sporomusa termitida TaxID=2377 RepID=A0A517DYW2_9FIRM|nr:glycosyltransferase family 2 protein [Sporomusa termitida]QDR82550.1 peptide S-glycosyltransferase, SunS family [Sporomusa termitida]
MNKTTSISLCLIAKNEAHCLTHCLTSVRQLVDEIIVVDTGSTDATAAIAADYGAAVFQFSWTDDFSAARNYAISQARGQWILVLDADEVLEPLSRHELVSYLQRTPAEGYYFEIISYLDGDNKTVNDYVVRLFKNKPAYRFSGSIHEQVAGSIQTSQLLLAPYTIHHYGYLPQESAIKHKFERNTAIIQKALRHNPQDPFLHYSLAIEHLQRKDFRQAGVLLESTLSRLQGTEGYIPQVLAALLLTKLAQPDDAGAEALFGNCLQALPDQGDLYCLYGVWLMQHNRWPEAAPMLAGALSGKLTMVTPGQVHCCLGDVYFFIGLFAQASEHYITAFTETTVGLYPLRRLLAMLSDRAALQACEPALTKVPPAAVTGLLAQIIQAGQSDLAIAVLLLSILESISARDLPRIISACGTYAQYLATLSPAHWPQPEIYVLLEQSSSKLLLQSRLLALSGGYAPNLRQALTADALQSLLLLAAVVQPSVPTTDPLTFWEGVFIGETHFAGQPDQAETSHTD